MAVQNPHAPRSVLKDQPLSCSFHLLLCPFGNSGWAGLRAERRADIRECPESCDTWSCLPEASSQRRTCRHPPLGATYSRELSSDKAPCAEGSESLGKQRVEGRFPPSNDELRQLKFSEMRSMNLTISLKKFSLLILTTCLAEQIFGVYYLFILYFLP